MFKVTISYFVLKLQPLLFVTFIMVIILSSLLLLLLLYAYNLHYAMMIPLQPIYISARVFVRIHTFTCPSCEHYNT